MKKLICLLCICALIVGGISAAVADEPSLPCPGFSELSGSDPTPDGGDEGGVGGGGGWPK